MRRVLLFAQLILILYRTIKDFDDDDDDEWMGEKTVSWYLSLIEISRKKFFS